MKSLKITLPIFIVVSIAIPITLYFSMFSRNGISHKAGDWANFSNFISVFVGFSNLVLFAFLTYVAHNYNESNDTFLNNRNRLLERPIISFANVHGRYFIQNIGNGPALNVAIKSNFDNNSWSFGYFWNSLQSGSSPESLNWTTNTNIICALYTDSLGHDYISFMQDRYLITIDCMDEDSVKKHSMQIEKARIEVPLKERD